jgi:hypothetical protein
LAGKRPAVMDFGTAAVRACEKIGDGGGYSGDHGPIPAAGKKRRARWSFSASQRSSGRLLAAAEDDGHDGCSVTGSFFSREREQRKGRGQRGRKKDGGGVVASIGISRGSSVA